MSDHGHSHGAALADHRGKLAAVLGITLTVLVVEVVGMRTEVVERIFPGPLKGRQNVDQFRQARVG